MESLDKLKPEFYRELSDPATGLQGFIVIDRQVNGAATGGIRMAENVSLEEVANLAREMTLKYGILNIKKDGAKSGIVAPKELSPDKKKEICQAFGRKIANLIQEKKYFPGQDLGINAPDLEAVFTGANMPAHGENQQIKSEYFTALTVYLTLNSILESKELKMPETTVVLEGFGKVGEQLARLLLAANTKLLGVSTIQGALYDPKGLDIAKILELREEHGDQFVNFYDPSKEIAKEGLILKAADVFIPGARPDSINAGNIDDLKFRIIVPVANIAATEKAEQLLYEKSITFIPGFVSNAGGILGYFLNEQGFDAKTVDSLIKRGYPQKVNNIIEEARQEGTSLSQVARNQAVRNIKAIDTEHHSSMLERLSLSKVLWILFKKLTKVKLDFILRPFALKYIEHKHFG